MQSASARPPCANIALVPEEVDPIGTICIDEWIAVNEQVHHLLFGPSSHFSLDAPGYLLLAPVTAVGLKSAQSPAGTSFFLDVLALSPAGFDEPGSLDDLPPDMAAAIVASEVSAGLVHAEMIRGITAVAVRAVHISRRLSNGQMSHSFYVLDTLSFEVAEALRAYRDSSSVLPRVPPPPPCDIDCNGDGITDLNDPAVCDALDVIDTQFQVCLQTEKANYDLCMKQMLRRGIGTGVVCGITCGFSLGLLCGGCLAGGLTLTLDKLDECEMIAQNMVNCFTARGIQRQNTILNACQGVGNP